MVVRSLLIAALFAIPCQAAPLGAPATFLPRPAEVRQVAQAETFDIEEAGLTMQIPAGWKASAHDDHWLVSNGDGRIAFIFQISGDSLKDTLEAFKLSQSKRLTEIVSDGPAKPDVINGITTYDESGTAKMDSTPIIWSIDVLQAKKVIAVYTIVETDAAKANTADVSALLSSLRRK